MHAIAHRGVQTHVRESALKVDWEKDPFPHQGIEPVSAAWQSNVLTNWAISPPLILICNQPAFFFFLSFPSNSEVSVPSDTDWDFIHCVDCLALGGVTMRQTVTCTSWISCFYAVQSITFVHLSWLGLWVLLEVSLFPNKGLQWNESLVLNIDWAATN